MILQALKEYYDQRSADGTDDTAPFGWEWKEIPFIILLDSAGNFERFEDTREGEGKKRRAKSFLVPQAVKRSSNVAANLLWDSASYIFGKSAKDKIDRLEKQRAAFIERLKNELYGIEVVRAVIQFLENTIEEELARDQNWNEIVSSNPNLSFRVQPNLSLVCEDEKVRGRLKNDSTDESGSETGICLVTGTRSQIKSTHTSIKGVYGAQSSGANIVSFNLDPFCSYGKKQGSNAPTCAAAEFAYTTAANKLLGKDSKQKMSVGDTTTIFWSQSKSTFQEDFGSFFSEPPKDNPDSATRKVRELFLSIQNGAYKEDDNSTPFYILGLAPNSSRISIRFWHAGTISQFANRIGQYFRDFEIIKPPFEPDYYSIWRILTGIAAQDKSENIPPSLAGSFMRSILDGAPYPPAMLQTVLRRIRGDTVNRVKPVRAALIKAYLERYARFYLDPNYREVGVELDTTLPFAGYHLGRLFAVLEKIQEEANPDIRVTIRERFYGSACTTPVAVFATLLRLKNHHLAKIESKGRVVQFERELGEILAHLQDFPAHLDLHDQGRFAIGYYHQRQRFFTKV